MIFSLNSNLAHDYTVELGFVTHLYLYNIDLFQIIMDDFRRFIDLKIIVREEKML